MTRRAPPFDLRPGGLNFHFRNGGTAIFRQYPSAPTADDIAWALIAAADAMGELGGNREAAAMSLLIGVQARRSRWVAIVALRMVWPRCCEAMVRRWRWGGYSVGQMLSKVQRARWFDHALAERIAASRRDAYQWTSR